MPPLLRSPPFPRVPAAVAAVSIAGSSAIDESVLAAIRESRVGGSFWMPPAALPEGRLVVACAESPGTVPAALAALRAKRHRRRVLIVPDAGWSRRLAPADVVVVRGEVDPWSILSHDAVIHALGGEELAALAVLAGAEVTGAPPDPRRVLADAGYRDPFTGEPVTIAQAVATLADWRRLIDANRGIAVAAGIAWWKRDEIERLLWAPRRRPLAFTRSARRAIAVAERAGGAVAMWPSRAPAGLMEGAARADVPLHRIEDGFIRSVGLGSALHPPQSIAVDTLGIHYDPARESDLEHILQTRAFPADLVARAEALMRTIVARGIGKYGGAAPIPVPPRGGERVVLVAGQVEDDLSVRLGGGGMSRNRDLLVRARAAEPGAEIWFRPHPDVDAGHRRGAIPDADALTIADRVVRGGGMAALLDAVDGVHVLTSLTGFEALIRGRDVTVHGMPFYAGWGLTRDLAPVPARRTRRLSIAELVAGVLILYPRYLDPVTGLPCPPEVLVDRLSARARPRASWLIHARAAQGRVARRLGLR